MGSPFRSRAVRSLRLPLAGLALAWLAAPLGAQESVHEPDPFAPGLRFSNASDPAQPWIPWRVSLAGAGELVWVGAAVGNPALLLYPAAGQGPAAPGQVDPSVAGAVGAVQVAGGRSSEALFSLVQLPGATPSTRLTRVRCHDRVAAAAGGAFGPAWTREFAELTAGNARLASDATGEALVAALFQKEAQAVHLDWLDPGTGALSARVTVAGLGLGALDLSDGGERALVVCGLDLWIVTRAGTVLHHETLAATTEAAALSGDGDTVVVGGFAGARVLRFDGSAYQDAFPDVVNGQLVATRADVSRGGETVAVGYWNFQKGANVRLRVLDGNSGAVLNEVVQTGSVAGLQNFPEAVAVTPDGARVAFGLWGAGDSKPEVLLLERGLPGHVLSADLPGSVYSLAIDPDGTRVAVGLKDAHANHLASTGEVRLYDTGERDVQVLGMPVLGGSLALAAEVGDAPQVLFLLGFEAAVPAPLEGVSGVLRLDLAQPLWVFPGSLEAGHAQLSLSVPTSPALLGKDFAVQAVTAHAESVALSAHVARPVFQ